MVVPLSETLVERFCQGLRPCRKGLRPLLLGGEHDAGERCILTEAKKKFISTVFRLRARGAGLQKSFSLAERGVGAKFLVWRPPGSML